MASTAAAPRRAVALDLDGVLIDGMQFHIAAWTEAFGTVGVRVDREVLYRLEGISTSQVVARIAGEQHLDLDDHARAAITSAKRARYRELFRVVELPGARQLVSTIVDLGYRLALVTGTTRESGERALAELGVAERFTCIVSGDDVARGKPAPDPYLRAREQLAVPPSHCLVVENAPPGVAAAKSAGLPCLGVATYLPLDALAAADVVVEDVGAVTAWLLDEGRRSDRSGPFTAHG